MILRKLAGAFFFYVGSFTFMLLSIFFVRLPPLQTPLGILSMIGYIAAGFGIETMLLLIALRIAKVNLEEYTLSFFFRV